MRLGTQVNHWNIQYWYANKVAFGIIICCQSPIFIQPQLLPSSTSRFAGTYYHPAFRSLSTQHPVKYKTDVSPSWAWWILTGILPSLTIWGDEVTIVVVLLIDKVTKTHHKPIEYVAMATWQYPSLDIITKRLQDILSVVAILLKSTKGPRGQTNWVTLSLGYDAL